MKIYLTDQSDKFPQHLQLLKRQPVVAYDPSRLTERVRIIPIDTGASINHLDTSCLFSYSIFPRHIMTYLTQWSHEGREMQVGDTIVQQVFLPPNRRLSQKLIMGARISAIIREPERVGFSYETLKGHAEKGISTFTIERAEAGGLVFKVHTLSKPGHPLTRLFGPVISLPYQAFCTNHCLRHVKRQLEPKL